MRWTLAGLVGGLLVALVVIVLAESLGNQLVGMSPDAAPGATAPPVTLALPVAGWFLGTLAGGLTAISISRLRWQAWVVAGFIFAAAGFGIVMMRYPAWVAIAGLVLIPAAAWLAQRLRPIGTVERA